MTRVSIAVPVRLDDTERLEIGQAIDRVVESGPWILGPEVDGFEREFASYLGADDVVGVGNGTDALAVAFTALELPVGSEVLVVATDGGYSATAARMCDLVPVVIDIDSKTLDPGAAQAEAAVTGNTAAIVITHLHGNAVDLGEIDTWRRSRGLVLIEDCAQAHGLRIGGDHVGGVGDAATYSFYPTKNLGALGDGGAVTFPSGSPIGAAERARALRQYGWGQRYRAELVGGRNSRLDSLQAAVLRARLPHLDRRNTRRRDIHARYADSLAETGRARMLGDSASTVAHHAVVLTASTTERESLRAYLAARGVDTAVHYPWLVSEMPGLVEPSDTVYPVASSLRDRMLSVPCAAELLDDEVDRVSDALAEWSRS